MRILYCLTLEFEGEKIKINCNNLIYSYLYIEKRRYLQIVNHNIIFT